MQATETTIQPKSLDELRETLSDWFPSLRRSAKFHTEHSPERLVLRSASLGKVHLHVNEEGVALQRGSRRLYLGLDNFAVVTEGRSDQMFLVFTLRRHLATRPLRQGLKAVEATRHPTFVARALNALKDLEHVLPTERIEEATTAPNDYLVLLNALTAASVATQLEQTDPLAPARLRGVHKQHELLRRSGGTLSAEQAAQTLGISRQAVDKRRRQGRLIGLTQGRRGYAYPAWQFESGRTLSNLEKVLGVLKGHDPWMQLTFFLGANERLNGKNALEALREDQLESVLQAAAAFGEHGAA